MSRRCELTDRGPATGNNVSHSNRKTRRRFLPNLQACTLESAALGRTLRMRISTRTLRTITKHGGIDAWLLKANDAELSEEGLRLKKQIRRALSQPAAASAQS